MQLKEFLLNHVKVLHGSYNSAFHFESRSGRRAFAALVIVFLVLT
jgi:uncharacterized membrane protein YwaF